MTDAAVPSNSPTAPHPKVVMSGMRPTGQLHLGHYMGVLRNWLALQNDTTCYFMVADWHALTTQYDRTQDLQQNILDMATDWLAAGVDPKQAHIYVQSQVPEIAELALLLGMLTPKKWLETDPTLKDMIQNPDEDLNFGLLGYPVLQTADILAPLGTHVPVGKDQSAHLEISRDIARRFNHLYNVKLFAEPQTLLTDVPVLLGLDGRKMSKSYNNAIALADSAETTTAKVKTAITDPGRVKKSDPGNPDACAVVYPYYQVFADDATVQQVNTECRNAQRGCVDCKLQLASLINTAFAPLRDKRADLAQHPETVRDILATGSTAVRQTASTTMAQVRQVMNLTP
jgi:tryptophanyl-tRNA synthetase